MKKKIDYFKSLWSMYCDEVNVKEVSFSLLIGDGDNFALVYEKDRNILFLTRNDKEIKASNKLLSGLSEHVMKSLRK